MDRAKHQLDDYTRATASDPHYIAYEMLDQNEADELLEGGERVLERNERESGYPMLQGLEKEYGQVKVVFEGHFEKRLTGLA